MRIRLLHIVVASVVIGLVAGGAYAVGASSSGGTIVACAKRHGGALRLAKHCRSTERRVTWAARGRRGLPGSARAYAYVQGGNSPKLVAARSRNVASVSSPDTGFYCIGLPPSIDASKTAPVVTPVYNTGFAGVPVFAQLVDKASVGPDAQCTGNQVEVWSGTLQKNEGGAPQAQPGGTFAFTVAVP